MRNSGGRESAEKRNVRRDNGRLKSRTKGETANAKGCERVSNEAANLMRKSVEYHENGDWQLRSVVRVI
jgi:hypothetical protein